MAIHQDKEASIDIERCPWQFLSIAVEEMAKRNRNATTACQRTLLKGHKFDIDQDLYLDTLKAHDKDDQVWLRHVGNLGMWTDNKLATFTAEKDPKCRYCGAQEGSSVHLALLCPHFHKQRFEGDPELEDLDMEKLPPPMQLGIPVHNKAVEGLALWPRDEYTIKSTDVQRGLASRAILQPAGRSLFNAMQQGAWARGQEVTTRQLIAQCRKVEETCEKPLPDPCDAQPPEEPNNFSDGTLKIPRVQFL